MNRQPKARDARQRQGNRPAATQSCWEHVEEAAGRFPRPMPRRSRLQAAGSRTRRASATRVLALLLIAGVAARAGSDPAAGAGAGPDTTIRVTLPRPASSGAPANTTTPIAPFGAPPAGARPAQAAPGTPADSVAAPAGAGETPPAVLVVGTVSVTGNTLTDSTRILRSFEVPSGMRYSPELIKRGVNKLLALGLFDDIGVDGTPHGQFMDLVIRVRERPRISKIEFAGNRKK